MLSTSWPVVGIAQLVQSDWGDAVVMNSCITLLAWLVILIVIALATYALFIVFRPLPPRRITSQLQLATPLDILKLRYARREITREQFWQIKKDLEM